MLIVSPTPGWCATGLRAKSIVLQDLFARRRSVLTRNRNARRLVCMLIVSVCGCNSGSSTTSPPEPVQLLASGAYLINRTPAESLAQTVPSVVGTGCTTFTGGLRVGVGDSVLLVRQYIIPPSGGQSGGVAEASPGRVRAVSGNRIILLFTDRADTTDPDNGSVPRTAITLNEHFPSNSSCNPTGVYSVKYALIP